MERKNFLLLLALSKESAAYGQAMLARVKQGIDANAAPLWIDAKGIGVFISATLSARDIWQRAVPDGLPSKEREAFRDMLILQLGPDCLGFPDTKAMAWLNAHRQKPG